MEFSLVVARHDDEGPAALGERKVSLLPNDVKDFLVQVDDAVEDQTFRLKESLAGDGRPGALFHVRNPRLRNALRGLDIGKLRHDVAKEVGKDPNLFLPEMV